MHKHILLFLFICLSLRSFSAHYTLYNLPHLNNQLSNNAILSMCQDHYGFMWFGSYDGLNFYDGKEVETFRFDADNSFSISGNSIHNITEADKNHLWISTQLGLDKFSLLERKVVESYKNYKKVQYIAINNENETWVLGRNDFICYYSPSSKGFEEIPFKDLKVNEVHTLFVDENQQLCLINKIGELYFIDLDDRDKEKKTLKLDKTIFHDNTINNLFQDGKQIYFIDSENDLFICNKSDHKKDFLYNITDIVNKYGNSLVALTSFKNEIYLAFLNGGLIKLNINNKQWESLNSSIGIFSILKDKNQDAIWVATDGQGVELYYNEENAFGNILLKDLPFTTQRPVRAIYTDEKNNLWIGSKGDGIIKINNYHKYYNTQIPNSEVKNIKKDAFIYCFKRSEYNNDNLWIGGNKLSYYSYKEDKIHDIALPEEVRVTLNDIHNLAEVNDSTLWVTCDGLWRIDLDKKCSPYKCKKVEKQILIKDGNVVKDVFFSMLHDGSSKLALGSRIGYGIMEYDTENYKYNYRTLFKGIGDVICLYPKGDSMLYIGTSSGLNIENKLRDKTKVQHFGKKDGIINDMIHGILEDQSGIIWLSTNKGLVKYNPQNDSFFNYQTYKIGVSEFSDGAYWHCPSSNRLFFGGINGLTWVEPNNNEEKPIKYEPNIIFTKLKTLNEIEYLYDYNFDKSKKIVIPKAQPSFEIAFTILDYISGDNYDNSYMLEGYDTSWISIQKNNNIQFIKIPPGKYNLVVKYKSDVFDMNDKTFSIPIIILPPWYLSNVAYSIYIFLFILLIVSLYFYTKWKFKRKQEIIAKSIKRKEREMLYESKMTFFTNITHELFTPLTLINGSLEQIKKSEQTDKSNKYLNVMQNNIQSLNELIQEILDFRKIEEGHLHKLSISKVQVTNLIHNLLDSYSTIMKANSIIIETSIPNELYWNTDKKCLKKIISNLLSNAFKYTPEEGLIRINTSIEDSNLIFSIYNTGKGIERSRLDKIFNRFQVLEETNVNSNNQMTARNGLGLYICHNMTKHLNGDITIESEVDKYTQFTVKLPIFNELSEREETEDIVDETPISSVAQEGNTYKEINLVASILIVDDNKEILELLSDILSAKYQILKAVSVAEAQNILKSETPALIITDIMMPEIDGFTFIEILRNNSFHKGIPIIALTAKINENDIINGYEKGVDAYITKPFSADILLSIVKRLITNKEEIRQYYNTAESAFSYSSDKLIHTEDKEFVQKVSDIVKENINNPELGPEFIANKMNISSRTLYRLLKKTLSITVSDFIRDFRLAYASRLLLTTNLTIKEIIYKIGLSNKSYFYNEFSKKYNKTPKEFRETNVDE